MNKINLIITIICTLLCVELAVFAQPRGMMMDDEDEPEEVVPTPEPEIDVAPLETPATPVSTPSTPISSEEPAKVIKSTIKTYRAPNSAPFPSSENKPATSTPAANSGVSYGSSLNRNNEGTGGGAPKDIEAPTPLEDKKYIKEPLVQDGVYQKMRLKKKF